MNINKKFLTKKIEKFDKLSEEHKKKYIDNYDDLLVKIIKIKESFEYDDLNELKEIVKFLAEVINNTYRIEKNFIKMISNDEYTIRLDNNNLISYQIYELIDDLSDKITDKKEAKEIKDLFYDKLDRKIIKEWEDFTESAFKEDEIKKIYDKYRGTPPEQMYT